MSETGVREDLFRSYSRATELLPALTHDTGPAEPVHLPSGRRRTFFDLDGTRLGLYPRDKLAEDATVPSDLTAAAYPGVDFKRARWPHGETGGAVVHGALFDT